jgi:hypothetical protein
MRPAILLTAGLLSILVFAAPAAAQNPLPYCSDFPTGVSGRCQAGPTWPYTTQRSPVGAAIILVVPSDLISPITLGPNGERRTNSTMPPVYAPRNDTPIPGRGAPAWEGDDPSRAGEITIVWD